MQRTKPVIREVAMEILVVSVLVASVGLISVKYVNWSFIAALDVMPVLQYYPALLKGLLMTVILTATTMVASTIAGILFAIASQVAPMPVRVVVNAYVEIFRSIPILITLFWVHFTLPLLVGYSLPVLVSGLLAMFLQASSFMTDVMRAGFRAVPRGQVEAARALSLSSPMTWRMIVLPQALRVMLPSISNVVASMLKASAILSALSVDQLWQMAQQIGNFTFKPLEALTIAAILYYIVGKMFMSTMRLLERRLNYPI
jgi:polar amino acid transport system permease protein